MQDRDGLLGRQRERSVEQKCSKGRTGSEGLQRVWRGKRSWKETSPERKKACWERALEKGGKNKKLKGQVMKGKDRGKNDLR